MDIKDSRPKTEPKAELKPGLRGSDDKHDGTITFGRKSDWWIALLVTLVSGIIFTMTAARGTTFWDCGEFIACAYILGVPHPPGAALFVMLGRAFSIIPFGDTAFILALFSAWSSALAVGFSSLAIARVIRRIVGVEETIEDTIWVYAGVLVGALSMAFGATYWFNAVEAEVYGLTLLLVALLFWLSMMWLETARTSEGNRILIMQIYILFLAATNHMQAFLPIIPMFLLIVLISRKRLKSPLFYIAFFLLTSVIHSTDLFLFGVPIACAAAFLWAFLTTNRETQKTLSLVGSFFLMAVVGYSLYAYVPIRSAQDPAIDENNPENWTNFKQFLERKQYSDKSMFELMFTRKGSWKNQFGTHERMGFWGHLINQWVPSPRPLYLYVPFLALFSLWAMWKSDRKIFLYSLSLLMLFTVAMTLYLNFSDGTRGVKLEVRDRDYFYTPGFVMISLLFGVGLSSLAFYLRRSTIPGGTMIARVVLILGLLVPPKAVEAHYFETDRSRFFVAEDLAYNMLVGLRENAIIFTGGDNDTFPLWYIQEVRSFRKDIQVVNLSLLNTPWYIMQLKYAPTPVEMSLDDVEIENLRGYYTPEGNVVTVKDIMVPEIIRSNIDKRPIYFAVTVPSSDSKLVEGKLLQEGLVKRVDPAVEAQSFDLAIMEENFLGGVYRFRGLDDPTVYKDRDTIRLLTNYNACLFNMANLYLRNGDEAKAEEFITKLKSFPHDNPAGYRMLIALAEMKRDWQSAVDYTDSAMVIEPTNKDHYIRKAEYYRRLGNYDDVEQVIEGMTKTFPNDAEVADAVRILNRQISAARAEPAAGNAEASVNGGAATGGDGTP